MRETTCPTCRRNLPENAKGPIDGVTGLMLAGWGRRAGQAFADGLVFVIPGYFIFSLFYELDGTSIAVAMTLVGIGAYFVPLWTSTRGQSLGNRVAVTRVRDAATGQRISFAQAFKRWAFVAVYAAFRFGPSPYVPILFYLVLLADCLYPVYDKRNQTLHDKFAGTIVVIA
ncbi:MAG TPA: RDD family protein [Acidimicrobiales bacterium]